MKKKINKKLSTSENPIFTEYTHEHLTTCDFRAGIIYHYYDPEAESQRRLLDVYKLKPADMDMDLEMLAKNQFKKDYKATQIPLKTNCFSNILDIKRGTNPDFKLTELKESIVYTTDHMDGIVKTAEIAPLGKVKFDDLFMIMSILSNTANKAIFWMDRITDSTLDDYSNIKKYLTKHILSDILILPESHYAIDTEGYMHPLDDEDVNLDSEYAIRLNTHIITQVLFEFTETDKQHFLKWKKRQKNLPF